MILLPDRATNSNRSGSFPSAAIRRAPIVQGLQRRGYPSLSPRPRGCGTIRRRHAPLPSRPASPAGTDKEQDLQAKQGATLIRWVRTASRRFEETSSIRSRSRISGRIVGTRRSPDEYSNVALNFSEKERGGWIRKPNLPLHTSNGALVDEFEEPTFSVGAEVAPRNSHAFAWSHLRAGSYCTRTYRGIGERGNSNAQRSVPPNIGHREDAESNVCIVFDSLQRWREQPHPTPHDEGARTIQPIRQNKVRALSSFASVVSRGAFVIEDRVLQRGRRTHLVTRDDARLARPDTGQTVRASACRLLRRLTRARRSRSFVQRRALDQSRTCRDAPAEGLGDVVR